MSKLPVRMNQILITDQVKNRLNQLNEFEKTRFRRTIRQLAINELQGVKLWGRRGLFIYEFATGDRIIYRKQNGGSETIILGLSVKSSSAGQRIKVSAVVLAAGKTASPFELPLPYMVGSLLDGGIDDLIVVLGQQSEQFKQELTDQPVKIVTIPEGEQQLSRSIRKGLKTIAPDCGAVLLTLGTRPFIRPGLINILIRSYKLENTPILVPTFEHEPGHPVVFSPGILPEFMRLKGNTGGKAVLKHHSQDLRHLEVEDRGVIACLGS